MDLINDSIFGDLQFNGYWMREVELKFLGNTSTVELIVEGNDEDESIYDEQRVSYQQLPNVIPMAESEILKFYQSVCEDYRSRFGDEAETRMPIINELSELSDLVNLTGVVFPMVMDPGEISVGFLLECSWDPEHGLGVKFTNHEFEVGTQDILT